MREWNERQLFAFDLRANHFEERKDFLFTKCERDKRSRWKIRFSLSNL